ncbi:hypothetical protein [Protaetiibacter larvae]|uniref:Uncharacterized protein n=1 Tax=Protaetiibacter larvae TaxID=2592654 RepID=A0A5C1Y8B9_9MICO|nr:hypothetical protein [Protaetiibacter larvae]QEO09475.1 hypothetical protein FLP23_05285 [Protaetiibacter larvae]
MATIEELVAELRRYTAHEVRMRVAPRGPDRRVPLFLVATQVHPISYAVQHVELLLDPRLEEAPDDTALYLAALEGIRQGANPYPFPERPGQSAIRRLLGETGDHPYRGTPRQSFAACTWDRQTRMLSGRRITVAGARWLDAREEPHAYPSWAGRLHVQEHEHEVWPEAAG